MARRTKQNKTTKQATKDTSLMNEKDKKTVKKSQQDESSVESDIPDIYDSDDNKEGGNGDDDDDKNVSKKQQQQQGNNEKSDDDDDDDSDDSDDNNESDKEEPRKSKFFSDENAAWLKPKKNKSNLLSSDDDDDDDDEQDDDDEKADMVKDQNDDYDDDGDDDDEEEELEIEKQSRLLDAQMELEEEEADEEMKETITKHTAIYHLPTLEELQDDLDRVIPPSELRSHVDSILEVLAQFKQRREPGRARAEYIERLVGFIAELYGYLPELVQHFMTMLGAAEAVEFIDASDKLRPLVIRTNTLRTRRKDLALALIKRGVSLDPLANWSKVGLKIMESPVPIGATPEYLSGHYMLQSAASMCPVMALAPQPKERVLDMSAAPGGKTSYIAQLMRNTGVIFANDLKADRQKATVANMHRLGVKNVITCTHDGRKLSKLFQQFKFDRILLDAPCSGLGVISRDPSVKVQRTMADVYKCSHLQKELLLAAIDVLDYKSKTGGVMVYSTCSVSVSENEEVINYALQKRDIKIIDTGLDFGKPGFTRFQQKRFHPSVALTRRFYPHVHNMDGFYVAKIQKLSDKRPGQTKDATTNEEGTTGDGANTETNKEEEKKGANNIDETSENNDSDNDDDDSNDENDKHNSKSKKTHTGKKRKKKRGDSGKESSQSNKKAKANAISVPPPITTTTKKKRMNAKVTKPRRKKPAGDI